MKLLIKRKTFQLNLLLLILLTIVSIIFYYNNQVVGQGYVLLCLFVYIAFNTIRGGLNKHITFLAFLVTYFTFLLSRVFITLFIDTKDLVLDLGGGGDFKIQTQAFIDFTLYISLLSVFVGYVLIDRSHSFNKKIDSTPFYNRRSICRVRIFAKYATYIISLFSLATVIDQIRYVMQNGYMDFYLNYKSGIPYIVIFIATLFDYFFIFYMATMPSKKSSIPVIILYLLVNIASLGMGQRGGAVLSIMFVISYFFLRNTINPGNKPWITKKGILLIGMSLPIVISLLFLMAYFRTDQSTDKFDNQNLALNFFYQQGVTVNVIGMAKEYENKIPENKLYSIGKIIEFAEHNKISQVLFDTTPVQPQTVEHALNDHTLHATLTYFNSPTLYFSGGGYGGCYIADLWVDWGIVGIIIGSSILGVCLAKIRDWCNESFWKASIGLLMYSCILFAPRANFIDFIYVFVPISALLSFGIIYIVKKGISIGSFAKIRAYRLGR